MTDQIGTIPAIPPVPTVGFIIYASDQSPYVNTDPTFTYTTDGNTYVTDFFSVPYNRSTVFDTRGQTFAADSSDPTNPISAPAIIEYYWDFGDGDFAYGPVVTHKFRISNPTTRVTLRITDAKGKRFYAGKQANLIAGLQTARFFSESHHLGDSLTRRTTFTRSATAATLSTASDSLGYSKTAQFGVYENEILV